MIISKTQNKILLNCLPHIIGHKDEPQCYETDYYTGSQCWPFEPAMHVWIYRICGCTVQAINSSSFHDLYRRLSSIYLNEFFFKMLPCLYAQTTNKSANMQNNNIFLLFYIFFDFVQQNEIWKIKILNIKINYIKLYI